MKHVVSFRTEKSVQQVIRDIQSVSNISEKCLQNLSLHRAKTPDKILLLSNNTTILFTVNVPDKGGGQLFQTSQRKFAQAWSPSMLQSLKLSYYECWGSNSWWSNRRRRWDLLWLRVWARVCVVEELLCWISSGVPTEPKILSRGSAMASASQCT